MLEACNVRKAYGAVTALAGVSLRAGPGVLALLGPNGSGKTTLLRILATVVRADAGDVRFGGLSYAGDLLPLRRVLGYQPQELQIPEHMTPRRFLQYMARLKGVPAERQVSQLLAELGLHPQADRPVRELSGGQVRRLALAQALLGAPRLLILDEPTLRLDPEERERTLAAVSGPPGGRVVILSSHVPCEVEHLARQVVVLRAGRVAFSGTVEELRRLADGKVYEVTVPAGTVPELLERHLVSRVTARGDVATLRIIGPPPAGMPSVRVRSSLEDAYLFVQRGCFAQA